MKQLFQLTSLIAFCLLLSTFSYAQGRQFKFGRGGFEWVIYENRQVYKLDEEGYHDERGAMFDKKSIKDLFNYFDGLKFHKIYCNKQAGDYWVIKYISPEETLQVAWVDPSELGKARHRIIYFYSMLVDFTK